MDRDAQIKYIEENYLTMPQKRIADNIGRSFTFVATNLEKLGLVIPEDIKKKFKQSNQFKTGHISFNKGKKIEEWMAPDVISKFKQSQFKKGCEPHNTKKDFDLSIRRDTARYSYIHIRISKGNWELFHRWLWTQIYGTIPPYHNIQFKDGDSLNCSLDNLYMVDRKDQAVINKYGGKKIPTELHDTILLTKSLKKRINEKQNHRPQ